MGKDKDKKKRKHDSSSDSSSDSGSDHKRHKKDKDKKHKKDKKQKKHKSKDSKKEKKQVKEAKKFLKQQKEKEREEKERREAENVPLPGGQAIESITADDYFVKNPEFSVWLTFAHGKYFNDLESSETRALFAGEFVPAWNARKLPKRFYDGIQAGVSRTKAGGAARSVVPAQAKTPAELADEEYEAKMAARQHIKSERKEGRQKDKLWLDEMLPKATGREAMVEKKMARREDAKAREGSPEMTTVGFGGGDVMGGGGNDDFQATKARMAASQNRRMNVRAGQQAERMQKLTEYQAAEEAKMAQFRAMVGLQAGSKVEIKKRE